MGPRVCCSNTDQYSRDVQGKLNVVFVARVTKMIGKCTEGRLHLHSWNFLRQNVTSNFRNMEKNKTSSVFEATNMSHRVRNEVS